MIYLTGDTHGDFRRVALFCDKVKSTKDDILIILGDAGINYYGKPKDNRAKQQLSELPITLFCIHGNHEMRPESISTYEEIDWHGGKAYAESEYPSIVFAKDGEVYELNGKRCIAIGGAYSVDKYHRLAAWGPRRIEDSLGRGEATEQVSFSPQGENEQAQSVTTRDWWADEQPSEEVKAIVEQWLESENQNIDIVLSHTCPMKYIPREMFLSCVDQSSVDNSTEEWLDKIEDKLSYSQWYCGHYHTDKTIDNLRFLFEDFIELRE